MYNRCQLCGENLWTNYAKDIGQCPECERADAEAQEILDELLEKSD